MEREGEKEKKKRERTKRKPQKLLRQLFCIVFSFFIMSDLEMPKISKASI